MARESWPFFYGPEVEAMKDPRGRVAFGLYAFKKELIFNGLAVGLDARLPTFCVSTSRYVIEFQKANDLEPDGLIGPKTAQILFSMRTRHLEHRFGIYDGLLSKLKTARSGNDPVAEGPAGEEGIMGLNVPFEPETRLEDAWDPAWALEVGASRLLAAIRFCEDEAGGIASWEIGRWYAREWVKAGKPPSGGPEIGKQDAYLRAFSYVQLVNDR